MKNYSSKLAAVIELLGRTDAENASGKKNEWLKVDAACERYAVSRWTLLRWRKNGWIKAKKLGRTKNAMVLIDVASVELFLATQQDFTAEGGVA